MSGNNGANKINRDSLSSNMNDLTNNISQILELPVDPESIPTGDMPGDKVEISEDHIAKAKLIMPMLAELLKSALENNPYHKAVVTVCGGSGVGKSETASLLSYYLNSLGVGTYTLSGDNYPHRIPKYNDAERLRIFRQNGIKGLIASGSYNEKVRKKLEELQLEGKDSDPNCIKEYPWLSRYIDAGRCGLRDYLGTENEINFSELTEIISQFKNGSEKIYLKRMGREDHELWYDLIDFSEINVLIIEWTHGNSYHLKGVDIPILLNSTPQETLEHRRKRNRDGGVDSQFTTMVLSIEQDLLISQAKRAKLIISKNCEVLPYSEFLKIMTLQNI